MKWSGKIGFAQDTEESAPSVFAERIVERSYYGDVLEFGRLMQGSDKINEDVTVGNQLSVVATHLHKTTFTPCDMPRFAGSTGRSRM